MSEISRKEFLKLTGVFAGGALFAPLLTSITGCSASSVVLTETAIPKDNVITYSPDGKLKNAGDSVILKINESDSNIILFREQGNRFTALNMTCTHKGCELIKRKNFFECPCHGSEFDLNGEVLKGPAEIPLQKFKTDFNNNIVKIFLK